MEGLEAEGPVGSRGANPLAAVLSSEASTSSFSRQPRPKQLIFDRRYGWVYEEWVEPSEHANIGGRGIFSIVPLTMASLRMGCQAVDVAANFVVRSIENRAQIVSEAQERWRNAGLQASRQFVRCVDTVPFLSKGRIALSASVEASLGQQQWEPVLQSASRISADLTSAGRAAGNELSHHFRDGVNLLRQGVEEGHRRAQEQLAEVLGQEGTFPPPLFHRLTGHWLQLSRQFNDKATHQLRQARAFLLHMATYVATYALAVRNRASESNTALSGMTARHVSRREDVRDLDYNDYLLSNSRLLTMVAAPSDDEQREVGAQASPPPLLSRASGSSKAYSRTGGKSRKNRLRNAQG